MKPPSLDLKSPSLDLKPHETTILRFETNILRSFAHGIPTKTLHLSLGKLGRGRSKSNVLSAFKWPQRTTLCENPWWFPNKHNTWYTNTESVQYPHVQIELLDNCDVYYHYPSKKTSKKTSEPPSLRGANSSTLRGLNLLALVVRGTSRKTSHPQIHQGQVTRSWSWQRPVKRGGGRWAVQKSGEKTHQLRLVVEIPLFTEICRLVVGDFWTINIYIYIYLPTGIVLWA